MDMKKLIGFMFISLLIIGCKEEGCTDSSAINYNTDAKKDDGSCEYEPISTKPIITIKTPSSLQEINSDGKLDLNIDFLSGAELSSTTITLSSTKFGGSYFAQTRAIDGLEDNITLSVDLPNIDVLGSQLISVTALNDLGESEFVDLDFELIDNVDPIITLINFYSDDPNGAGTPHSKFTFEVTDNYGLENVKWEVYYTNSDGSTLDNQVYESSKSFSIKTNTFSFDEEFQINGSPASGQHYIGIITTTDLAGNEIEFRSAVGQYF
jgi:hypothetical protein